MNILSEGDPTGASSNTGEGLLYYLTGLVSWEEKGTKGISLLGIDESRQLLHAHILFCILAGDYAEPHLWGVLGPLPDDGTPTYANITLPRPCHELLISGRLKDGIRFRPHRYLHGRGRP